MAIDNILANENYISKDFQSIYTEYVNAVGKLNNKWLVDGEGNESDPGVILIKLLAASDDKITYINDRANLESYPDTVEIEADARSNFSPVYNMHWYRSGTGYVNIMNNSNNVVTLPSYLMLCSEDNSHIYTINQSVNDINPGAVVRVPVIEGKIKTFTVSGSDKITIDSFVDNKIYFDDYNIAENGIYVDDYNLTSGGDNATAWTLVDNIYVKNWSKDDPEDHSGKYFQFRVDPITDRPYLQFVDDLVDKIGDGLKIRYILSNGVEGNISSGKLTKVYASDSEVVVDSDNLIISNILPIGNGKNPETIESAKRNYFKAIDICHTLVTLRDYANAIYLADGLVSNCFVCDKTNDVQTTYKIKRGLNTEEYSEPINDEELSVIQLKFYGLTYSNIDNGVDEDYSQDEKQLLWSYNYALSFDPINPVSGTTPLNIPENVINYIKSTKAINHEFASIRNDRKICMLKNYYKLNINLLYRQRLSDEQQADIQSKIYYALLNGLNAHEVDFGERITYQKVQSIIYSTDDRILGASISGLDDTDFTTAAVYWSPYITVPTQTVSLPQRGTPNSFVVLLTGNNAELYKYNAAGDGYDDQAKSAIIFNGDARPTDIPAASSTANLEVVYQENKSWIDNYYTATAPSGTVYISTSKPSETLVTPEVASELVYQVQLTNPQPTSSPSNIDRYPSTPTQFNTSNTYVIIGGNQYTITFTHKVNSGNYYHVWKYDNQPYFVYFNNEASTATGQFYEKVVNSEIIEANQSYDDNCKIGVQDSLTGDFQTEIYAKNVLAGKASVFDTDFEFSPTIADTDAQLQSNIICVKPNLKLTLNDEYQLKEFEYIQFLNPQYNIIANYSFYVYMGYYNTANNVASVSIGQNQNYKLGDGEYVIFYYRSNDEDNFSFTAYNQGNIVCPSKEVQLINLTFQKSIINGRFGTEPTAISGIANDTLQAQINKYKNQITSIKSQDSCDVKRAELKTVGAYSFVTADFQTENSGLTTTYTLSFNQLSNGKYVRVLENGEQFNVYKVNGSQVTLEDTLQAGDLIISASGLQLSYNTKELYKVDSANQLTYAHTDITEIIPGSFITPIFGVSASLSSNNFTPSVSQAAKDSYEHAAYTNQIIIMSSQVNIGYTSGDYNDNVTSGTTYSSGNSIFTEITNYIKNKVETTQWTGAGGSQTMWVQYYNQHNNNGVITTDSDPVYFSVDYNITIASGSGYQLSGEFELYSVNKIKYREENDTMYHTIEFSDSLTIPQLIRSALGIDIDKDNSQLLSHTVEGNNTSIQQLYGYGQNDSTIFNLDNSTPDSSIIISSNQAIAALGGKQRLTQSSTIYAANKIYNNISNGDSITYYDTKYPFILYKLKADGVTENKLSVPNIVAGNGYVIYITNYDGDSSYNLTNVSIYTGDGSQDSDYLKDIYGVVTYRDVSISSEAHFTINMNVANTAEITIKARVSSEYQDVTDITWQIDKDITPYANKIELGDTKKNAILAKMAALDKDNEYIISNSDNMIDNPIAAASFLDKNHFYNKFTICQMNLDGYKIK